LYNAASKKVGTQNAVDWLITTGANVAQVDRQNRFWQSDTARYRPERVDAIGKRRPVDALYCLATSEPYVETESRLEVESANTGSGVEQEVQRFASSDGLHGQPNQAIAILERDLAQNLRLGRKWQYRKQSASKQSHLMQGQQDLCDGPKGQFPSWRRDFRAAKAQSAVRK
jgi:hypothetical protein